MFSSFTSRRGFAARLATILPGLAVSGTALNAAPARQGTSGVRKLDYQGKPAGTGFITL
jgi:hypothetical protein